MKASEFLKSFPRENFSDVWENKLTTIKYEKPDIDKSSIENFIDSIDKIFELDNNIKSFKEYLQNNENIEINENDISTIKINGINIINRIIGEIKKITDFTPNDIYNIFKPFSEKLNGYSDDGSNYLADDFIYSSYDKKISTGKKIIDNYIEKLENVIRIIKLENKNKENELIIKEKEDTIENTSKEQTKELIGGFKELESKYRKEEDLWLFIGITAFFLSFSLSLITLIDKILPSLTIRLITTLIGFLISIVLIFLKNIKKKEDEDKIELKYNKEKNIFKKIGLLLYKNGFLIFLIIIPIYFYIMGFLNKTNTSIFGIEKTYYTLIPITIIIFSFLYFSLYQYSKAKQLRIENQNKIALIHGILSMEGKNYNFDISKIYENFANVVFTKVYSKKVSNDLPIDKVLDLAISTIEKTNKN